MDTSAGSRMWLVPAPSELRAPTRPAHSRCATRLPKKRSWTSHSGAVCRREASGVRMWASWRGVSSARGTAFGPLPSAQCPQVLVALESGVSLSTGSRRLEQRIEGDPEAQWRIALLEERAEQRALPDVAAEQGPVTQPLGFVPPFAVGAHFSQEWASLTDSQAE